MASQKRPVIRRTIPSKKVTTQSAASGPPRVVNAREKRSSKAPADVDGRPKLGTPWTVLIYLAGDVEGMAAAIQKDLKEILAVGVGRSLAIAVQHDGPGGTTRHVVRADNSRGRPVVEKLGRLNSGSREVFADFLRWGLSACPADRVALVLKGMSALVPVMNDTEEEGEKLRCRVFTICRDDPAGGFLDVADIGEVIGQVLQEQKREQFELLAVDSGTTQFLELAYELEGRVQVLLGSQVPAPGTGWNYTRILRRWRQEVTEKGGRLDTTALAELLVGEIRACYRSVGLDPGTALSALDLRRLDEVARAADTFCIGLMQSLGEGLIWETRRLLMSVFDAHRDSQRGDAYDCGSFFILTSVAFDAMADEAYQGWLGTSIKRASPAEFSRFTRAMILAIEPWIYGTVPEEIFDRWVRGLEAHGVMGLSSAALRALRVSIRPRLKRVFELLRAARPEKAGGQFLEEIGRQVGDRLRLLRANSRNSEQRVWAGQVAIGRDLIVEQAIRDAFQLLTVERQRDLLRLRSIQETARRLAQQARQTASALLGDVVAGEGNGFGAAAAPSNLRAGMILPVDRSDPAERGWPRWSGVSLYRPPKLDELMSASYRRFAFHHRVHWAAMLGAANLIHDHPRALWRLVSSLLATGAAGTRRDLLRRLTGPDSVIWGLREQFRVMAPAPALTLSLERRRGLQGGGAPMAGPEASRENYLLRLESVSRGAVITEQLSRVQPQVMDRALQGLAELLGSEAVTGEMLRRLRAIGGVLGEDVFQALGAELEDERRQALEGASGTHVHLQLQIPRELMRYPWELMHHRGEWLSERFAVGRQVFMETGMARRVTRRQQGRIRPLIIGDPVFDAVLNWPQLPGARTEAEQVAGWFERLRADLGDVIDFDRTRDTRIATRLTAAELRDLLRSGEYDIVHFAGHGLFRGDDPETSAWLVSDGELWALEIRNTLADSAAPPWLVYANACESAMESDGPRRQYQGNVFGLATAFLNQGVAAYIAPLWPIDDLLAQRIALDFYRSLLCDRATLGEALRRAKAEARRITYPDDSSNAAGDDSTWTGLGWASLVLYGDPTEELFQALAGSGSKASEQDEPAYSPIPPGEGRGNAGKPLTGSEGRYLHAPDHLLTRWVRGPGWEDAAADRGLEGPTTGGQQVLELVEEAGFRRWQVRSTGVAGTRGLEGGSRGDRVKGLRGSCLKELLSDDRLRHQLPSRRGIIRILGGWILGGIAGAVEAYDKDQVKKEGLLCIPSADPRDFRPAERKDVRASSDTGRPDRLLLLVHGTFSKTASPVVGFGPAFLKWAREKYHVVLGFDHWTLSKDPEANARLLVEQLRSLDATLLTGRRIDVIAHSRGGLVARAFTELLSEGESAVRNLIFMGTPNCGTDLANPENWGTLADTLVNMTGLDPTGFFGKLAGLLAELAVRGAETDIPGLLAQNPNESNSPGSFLSRLQQKAGIVGLGEPGGTRIRHSVIAADFEPGPMTPNMAGLLKKAKELGFDSAADALFADCNDLVVNTAHTWCLDQGREKKTGLPAGLDPERVLVFSPESSAITLPLGIESVITRGVHHCNLFNQSVAQDRIKKWLSE